MSIDTPFKVRFRVRSDHPTKSTQHLVREIREYLPEIAKEVDPEGRVELTLEKEETFPEPGTVIIIIGVILAKGALEGMGKEIGKDVWEKLKDLYRSAKIEIEQEDSDK